MIQLVEKEKKNLRFRMDDEFKQKWLDFVASKNMKQQAALTALISWFMAQDTALHGIVFGMVEPTKENLLPILKKMIATSRDK